MELREIERLREENQKKRSDALTPYTELWENNCKSCKLVAEGVESGILPKGMTKDRQNDVCNACPVQTKLWDIGETLGETMREEQKLRRLKSELFGESKRDRLKRLLAGEYDEK